MHLPATGIRSAAAGRTAPTLTLLAALLIIGAAVTGAAPAQAASPSPSLTALQLVEYFSTQPLATAEPTAAASLPVEAQSRLRGSNGLAVPKTATPTGYKLRAGAIDGSGYVYNSAYVYAIEASCSSSGCVPVQQVRLRFKEFVYGGSSKRWLLTLSAVPYSGPTYLEFDYAYECGVNIAGARDSTCSTYRSDSADGPSFGPASNGTPLNRGFGSSASVTKFPMVNFTIGFADGSFARGDDGQRGEKFRGWDVCVTASSTKPCSTTGDGS